MKRIKFFGFTTVTFLFLCLMPGIQILSWALDINEIFNRYTSLDNNGTTLTIGAIPIGGRFYWGQWELNMADLSFHLKRAGELDQEKYLNIKKVCELVHHSVSLSGSQLDELQDFRDYFNTSGCLEYRKFTKGEEITYCCIATNFLKILGVVDGNQIVAMEGFHFPLFMEDGESFSGEAMGRVFQNEEEKGNFKFYYTISIQKAVDRWIETYTYINITRGIGKITFREIAPDYSWFTTKVLSGQISDIE